MAQAGSIAPRERINIVYKPATGDAQEEIELPLKLLVLGDFKGTEESASTALEDRKPVSIDKNSFDEVLKSHRLHLELSVPNRLTKGEEALAVDLRFERLRDFEPAAIVEQVPALARLLRLRTALTALKGPMGNAPSFRRKLQALASSDTHRQRLLAEVSEDIEAPEEKKSGSSGEAP